MGEPQNPGEGVWFACLERRKGCEQKSILAAVLSKKRSKSPRKKLRQRLRKGTVKAWAVEGKKCVWVFQRQSLPDLLMALS